MQGSRNIDILMHIRDYCAEINHTMDTFGRDYDIFVSNSIYQNAVALCVLQIGELTTHFTDELRVHITSTLESDKSIKKCGGS